MQVKKLEDETGEMTQWLKSLAALAEDPCSDPNTHIGDSELSITLVPWVLSPLVGSAGTACSGNIYMHEEKSRIQIKIKKAKMIKLWIF